MKTKQCGACGAKAMSYATRDLHERYKGEEIVIKEVPGWYCNECGESEFATPDEAERFSRETAAAMARIDTELAAWVRDHPQRDGKTQTRSVKFYSLDAIISVGYRVNSSKADIEIERAWQIEINNRLREIDTGVVKCIPWEEARDRLYQNADAQR